MLKGFRDFILRGNVIDLAVAVIIGTAFTAVVSSISADVITPIIGALFGQPDFSALTLGPILIGNFLNALIAFLITAFVVYFFIVSPMNALLKRFQTKTPEPQNTKQCPECLSDIPATARRCAFCTSVVA